MTRLFAGGFAPLPLIPSAHACPQRTEVHMVDGAGRRLKTPPIATQLQLKLRRTCTYEVKAPEALLDGERCAVLHGEPVRLRPAPMRAVRVDGVRFKPTEQQVWLEPQPLVGPASPRACSLLPDQVIGLFRDPRPRSEAFGCPRRLRVVVSSPGVPPQLHPFTRTAATDACTYRPSRPIPGRYCPGAEQTPVTADLEPRGVRVDLGDMQLGPTLDTVTLRRRGRACVIDGPPPVLYGRSCVYRSMGL